MFYVNLGDGEGGFTTLTFNPVDGESVYGVAAADFNGDGQTDVAAVNQDYLYIYKGLGQGAFEFLAAYNEFEFTGQSSIANFDSNSDGWQDLIVAGYGSAAGVALLLGDGKGHFSVAGSDNDGQADIYLCETSSSLAAVAGPPYEPNQNPVAVIKIKVDDQKVDNPLEVMAGQEVEFVGTESSDDGEIKSYLWDFGDGTSSDGTFFHTYYEVGAYPVTLEVTDDKGAVASVQITLTVTPVPVTVKFSPNSLDLKSRGEWVQATIKVPDGIDAARIVRDSITVGFGTSDRIKASPDYKHTFLAKLWRKIRHRMNVVTVKFNRQAVIKAIGGPNANAVLTVEGKVLSNSGRADFAGSGTIKTYEKQKRWIWGSLKKHPKK